MKYTVICKELTWSTVEYEVEANSEEEVRRKIEFGDCTFIYSDFDALLEQHIKEIKKKENED